MIFFKNAPTIKQVNYYLKPTLERLLLVHQKVSNPDFERELRELTGIGWKQVKNYRNHPNPNQRIRDNSKIQYFVLKERSKDLAYQFRRYLVYLLVSALIVAIIGSLIIGVARFVQTPQQSLEQLIDKRINQQIKSLPLKNCSKISSDKIQCPDGIYKRSNPSSSN